MAKSNMNIVIGKEEEEEEEEEDYTIPGCGACVPVIGQRNPSLK